ncbi:hypothetical protein F2P45_04820 [Massilia sp. CCM 8733]|uniref:Uncharacterized protein n=1 Tax=Massilia mucilaginosa TaxID=2609282 RepID=A0ABX0NNI1_9BURK|nr:hypothetical protein [Massilia mucilaginosa]NHZ88352.1 hypothetical protein [Massilia mucilaginosa]
MEIVLKKTEILEVFARAVPSDQHMLQMFAAAATKGVALPYTEGLCEALACIDFAVPGYAAEMISRIASVKGIGESQYESLVQIASEIYATCGAVQSADADEFGSPLFTHEPRLKKGKNPEFEACAEGLWYAVEVKAP